jgi:hypothetical protein
VRLPDNTTTDGFLGLYDHDIVIVTCLGLEEVSPIDFNGTPACPDGSPLLAAGRAFKSGNLMAMSGSVHSGNTWVPDSQDISKVCFDLFSTFCIDGKLELDNCMMISVIL